MRIIAILAAYNEERFIGGCLEHLIRQGLQAYLIDNCSKDRTVAIAERYLNRGLIGIESLPRGEAYSVRHIMERKEELAASLDADWFMHVDPDEIRLPPHSRLTLAQALAQVDGQGYNSVNFFEFTFIPTLESPDHDHADFQETMRWYYPFLPFFPHRLNAWKRQPARVELVWSDGHQVRFPDLRMYPESFRMRHYLFLSVPHAIRKYVNLRYDPAELQAGSHGWRASLKAEMVKLPSQAELRAFVSDDLLDPSNPRTVHYLDQAWATAQKKVAVPNNSRLAAGTPNRESKMSNPEDEKETGVAPVCITGMHRSGTSMVARLLNLCGLYLGRESDLINPAPDNPEGYWENARIVKIDEAVLGALGGAWDLPPVRTDGWERDENLTPLRQQAIELCQEFAHVEPWGWKDPRTSLTLPFWTDIFPDLRVIVCVRNPVEVARSLYRRGYSSNAFAFELWKSYNERLLRATVRERRLVTHHESYFADPEGEIRRVLDWLGLAAPEETITKAAATVSTALRHHRVTEAELRSAGFDSAGLELYQRLCDEAGAIYARVSAEAADPSAASTSPPADAAPQAHAAVPQSSGLPVWERIQNLELQLDALEQERQQLQEAFAAQARWARQLEDAAKEQEKTIRAYRRVLAPILPFARAARVLKARLMPRR